MTSGNEKPARFPRGARYPNSALGVKGTSAGRPAWPYGRPAGGSVAIDPEGKRVLSASVGQLFMAGVVPGMMVLGFGSGICFPTIGNAALHQVTGQIYAMFVLTVAAAEAAVGLAILVTYFRNRGDIAVDGANVMKG